MRANANAQTIPKSLENSRYDSDVERHSFNDAVANTLKQADLLVAEKQNTLEIDSSNE